MFTVTWNLLGFQVVDQLPTGTKMNSDYFITNILEPLERKIFPNGRKSHAKRLTVTLDNCSIQPSGANEVFMDEHKVRDEFGTTIGDRRRKLKESKGEQRWKSN
jgi:hypothetical protein